MLCCSGTVSDRPAKILMRKYVSRKPASVGLVPDRPRSHCRHYLGPSSGPTEFLILSEIDCRLSSISFVAPLPTAISRNQLQPHRILDAQLNLRWKLHVPWHLILNLSLIRIFRHPYLQHGFDGGPIMPPAQCYNEAPSNSCRLQQVSNAQGQS